MNPDGRGILARLDATDEEISRDWGLAISAALREHERAGVPVAVWDDEHHRVVSIPPAALVNPVEGQDETVVSRSAT